MVSTSKVIILAALVCAVTAEHGFSSQHVHKHDGHHTEVSFKDHHGHKHYDYYTPPKFDYEYKVDEPHDATRHVHYHGDEHSGFHADLKHEVHHPPPKHHHH